MSVQLNHTIVSCRDQQRSAEFLTGILGLRPGQEHLMNAPRIREEARCSCCTVQLTRS
jgi:catechol 2,3-dioxygenase-like lactoylglutathione lyase family enzyme